MATQRMHRGLVALSASAIATVYAVGLLHTQPAAANLAAQVPPEAAAQAVSATSLPLSAPSMIPPTSAPTLPLPIPSPSPVPATSTSPGVGSRERGSPRAPAGVPASAAAPAVTPTPASPAPSAPTAVAYQDGTYAGTGTSRFGNVEVAVTVQGGRIANVALTRVTTKYPASRIAALPGQVVARQSAQVDNVSGATASAQAFRSAVQQALGKAAAA